MTVRHATFGVGTIIDFDTTGYISEQVKGRRKALVKFEDDTLRWLVKC